MNVLVDTCIWSLALRRHSPGTQVAYLEEFKELISEARVRIIVPVRQEILSGIKSERQFEQLKHHLAAFPDAHFFHHPLPCIYHELKHHLAAFPDAPTTTEDFEQAAHFFNLARSKGIQGSNTDFLICAVATRRNLSIFTVDQDFEQFQRVLPIRLHGLRG